MLMKYQKLYATLAGRVDTAISYLEHMTGQQTFDWLHVAQVTEMLKASLLEAEEQYIDNMDDKPDSSLIVLPPQGSNFQS